MKRKVVGVIGGLGPGATLDFFERILDRTPTESEAAHLHVIIDCNPGVPDINLAALGEGPSAERELCRMAQNLEQAGADFLVMVCNAGHIYADAIRQAISIPFVSLVEETVRASHTKLPAAQSFGVLATDGCLKTGLYQEMLSAHGLDHLVLNCVAMNKFMDGIYKIKTGDQGSEPRKCILQAVESLVDHGADAIIAGCTEVMLVLSPKDIAVPLIDPLDILVQRTIEFGLGNAKFEAS